MERAGQEVSSVSTCHLARHVSKRQTKIKDLLFGWRLSACFVRDSVQSYWCMSRKVANGRGLAVMNSLPSLSWYLKKVMLVPFHLVVMYTCEQGGNWMYLLTLSLTSAALGACVCFSLSASAANGLVFVNCGLLDWVCLGLLLAWIAAFLFCRALAQLFSSAGYGIWMLGTQYITSGTVNNSPLTCVMTRDPNWFPSLRHNPPSTSSCKLY